MQDIQLVVSDPKACNNIVVKDQAIFEETEAFILYVCSRLSTHIAIDIIPCRLNKQLFGPTLFATLGG